MPEMSDDVPSPRVSAPASCSRSPTRLSTVSHRPTNAEAEMQIQQFLDEWHYCIIHSGLGRHWCRKRVLDSMFSIMEINGCFIDEEFRAKLHSMDERYMIMELVEIVPDSFRYSLEDLSKALEKVMYCVSDVRKATETFNQSTIVERIEAHEQTSDRISHELLRHGIVQAAHEVAKSKRCRDTWVLNTNKRLDRLTNAARVAEVASQQLLAVEAQLASHQDSQKAKGKTMLQGLADKNDSTKMHTAFSAWLAEHVKIRAQKEVRDKYEGLAKAAEDALITYREKRILNVRNVLMRKAGESDRCLLHLCVETWQEDIEERRRDGDTKKRMQAMESQLGDTQRAQKENTKRVMARMAADSADALVSAVFAGWVQFSIDYKKNFELEEQVRAAEKRVQEHMAKKKEEAKGVLDRMSGSTSTGLLAQVVQAWAAFSRDEKQARVHEEKIGDMESRFKSLNQKQMGNARGVQTRVNDQVNANIMLRIWGAWSMHAKVEKVEKYYHNKIESKRKQLSSVQNLFKSFSKQLEQGLSTVDEDSSARSNRPSVKKSGKTSDRREPSGLSGRADSKSSPIEQRRATATT